LAAKVGMTVVEILRDILIVLVAAKVAAEIAERIKVPAVVGEIAAGVVIGPSVLGLVGTTEVLEVLAEIGVILLLLQVGLEMDVRDLAAVGRASMSVAVIGVILPIAMGFGVGVAFAYDSNTALFLGAALAATSVGITARVFSDLRVLTSVEARTVLGAAVADDVLGLVILTVVVRVVTEGTVSLLSILQIVGVAVLFLVLTAWLGGRFGPPLFRAVQRNSRSAGTLVALALAFTLLFAELADAAQLAPIIGAFVAGLSLSRSELRERIERDLTPVGHLFIPVFFLAIGINVDVTSFARVEVLEVAAALTVVAVIGKILAAAGAIGSPGDKTVIGFGMLPRGEVGLIFATIGLKEHVLGDNLYASLLLVVLLTTLLAPPLLRWRLQRLASGRRPQLSASDPMPEGGWLWVDDGVVDLAGRPPPHRAVIIALEAALAISDGGRPGPRLLEWLGAHGDEPLRWDEDATGKLFEVLVRGNERAWRFLEASGVLERALPELAATVERRRADPHLLDASQLLQFELVDRIRSGPDVDRQAAEEQMRLEHPEWLLLAALILDTAGEDSEPVPLARRLVQRLDLGAAAEQEIALLVGNPGLLRAAAGRVEGLDEESVLKLASHLERPERARALYLLSTALGELEPVERSRMDELYWLVMTMLEQPNVTGLEVRNLVEQRRAETMRLVTDPTEQSRVEHAPRAYLLSQAAAAVARQVRLLDRPPGRNEARVALYESDDSDEWELDVASRDRPGLLAHVSGVLVDYGLDVHSAVIATWRDGAALESFRVRRAPLEPPRVEQAEIRGATPPDPRALEKAIAASFDAPLVAAPNPDAEIAFDDAGSPWYTLCEVRSPDRRGLLHTITAGMAAAGASVHSARLETVDTLALDRFELTDDNGRKLDAEGKDAVRTAIRAGVTARRRRFRLLSRT
jgi:Kef-type K+ transport system membrane component KefB